MKLAPDFMKLAPVFIELAPNFMKLRANSIELLSGFVAFSMICVAYDVIGVDRRDGFAPARLLAIGTQFGNTRIHARQPRRIASMALSAVARSNCARFRAIIP